MASPVEPLAPRPQAPLPAAGDELGSGLGKLRPEPWGGAAGGGSAVGPGPAPERPGRGRAERAAPPSPPPSPAGRASPAGGPGAQCARGSGGWGSVRAPFALALFSSVPSSSPSSFYFWPPPPPPPPSLLPSSSAFHLPVRLPGREGAAAAAAPRGGGGDAGGGGGGGQEAAPLSVPPSSSPRGGGGSGGGRRRLFFCSALQGLLLPARAGLRLPLGPAARRAGSPGFPGAGGGCPGPSPGGGGRTPRRPRGAGFALAAASPLLFGSDMEDGPSNNASCFRRLTECFLSPSKCRAPHSPRSGARRVLVPGLLAPSGLP